MSGPTFMVIGQHALIGTFALLCASVAPGGALDPDWTSTCAGNGCKCDAAGDLKRADCSNAGLVGVPGDLSGEVQSLDVSNNFISELGRDAFRASGLGDLRTLTVCNCSVTNVDKDAFRGLEALVELDMSNNRVTALNPATFRYAVRLRKILLRGNPLRTLSNGLFADLTSVREVELDGCMLTAVQPEAFLRAVRLSRLTLTGNRLAYVSAQVLSSVPGLRDLEIFDNPWKCDCRLRPFSDTVIQKKLYKPDVLCAEPERLRGKRWSEIKPEEFICKPVIQYPTQDGQLKFTGQVPWTIGCQVYGDPTPEVQWLLNNYTVSNDYTLNESTVVNNTRWINITKSKSQWMEPSEFKCVATNIEGWDERKVTVVVKNTSKINNESSISTKVNSDFDYELTISIVGGSVVVMILLIMYYMFYYRQRSQKPMSDTELANLNRLLQKMVKMNSLTADVKVGDESSDGSGFDQPDLGSDVKKNALTFPWDGHVQHSNSEEPSIRKDDSWEVPRSHINVCSLLGEGNFGQVWKCEATIDTGVNGHKEFAVKTLKSISGERERLDLSQELEVMKTLEPHINVVRLLGCCSEKDPLLIIMEFVKFGKLQNVLRNSKGTNYYSNMHGLSSLTSHDLINICYQVSNGMDFLSSKGIVHRDLATRNVLVTDEWACKVSDFGFARRVDADSRTYVRKTERPLPVRWTAPESLYDDACTVKSDVWSFGVLVWEVVTLGSTPYPGVSARGVMDMVRAGRLMDRPRHCGRPVYDVMRSCWRGRPDDRPDFAALRDRLGAMLADGAEYVRLDDVRPDDGGPPRRGDDPDDELV